MSLRQQVVWPTSPDVASLGEYGDVPVNLYTGTANVSIPGPVLKGNHLSIATSINYATGGIKVDDPGTSVGLGWSLQAGGSITRAVRNIPDTECNYFAHADEIEPRQNAPGTNSDLFDWYEFYNDVARNEIEIAHDIYYYNFNGRSGKFYISPRKEIFQMEDSDLKIKPSFNSVTSEVLSFEIIDEYGHKYFFGDTEVSRMQLDDITNGPGSSGLANSNCQYDSNSSAYDIVFNSAWHLSSINSYGGFESIDFTYVNGSYDIPINQAISQSRTFKSTSECCMGTSSGQLSDLGVSVMSIETKKYLNRIKLISNSVQVEDLYFGYQANSCGGILSLEYIEHFREDLVTGSSTEIGKTLFKYDCSTGRLTLKEYGVTEPGTFEFDHTLMPPHQFEYMGALPSDVTSTSIDHWGYYNGASNGTNLIPSYSSPSGHNFNGANREVNSNYSDHGSLNKIIWPTRGYTSFDFATNSRYNSTLSLPQYTCEPGVICPTFVSCQLPHDSNCCSSSNFISNAYNYTPTAVDISRGYLLLSSDSICDNSTNGQQSLLSQNVQWSILDSLLFAQNNNSLNSQSVINQTQAWEGTYSYVFQDIENGYNPVLYQVRYHEEASFKDTIALSSLVAGRRYRVTIGGIQTITTGDIRHRIVNNIDGVEPIGGVRISSISNYEQDGTLLTKKVYNYNDDSGRSTGRLMNEPVYTKTGSFKTYHDLGFDNNCPPGTCECMDVVCSTVTVSANSRSTLGTTQGSIVGYDRVTETIVSNANDSNTTGRTVNYYHNVPHNGSDDMDHPRNGKLLKKEIYNSDDQIVLSEDYQYSWDIGDDSRQHQFTTFRVVPAADQDNQIFLFKCGSSFTWDHVDRDVYDNCERAVINTKFVHDTYERMVNYTVYLAETERKQYFYDQQGNQLPSVVTTETSTYGDISHLQMTQSSVTNSDSKIHTTDYIYLDSYNLNGTINNLLKDNDKLLPAWQMIQKVNNTQIDGTRYIYDEMSTTNGGPLSISLPMVKRLDRFERTWDDNGQLLSGQWVAQSTIDGYEPNLGLIAQISDEGWMPRSYTYNSRGQAATMSFGDYVEEAQYNTSTHQIEKSIAVDGTSSSYTYDQLYRLRTTTDDQRGVTTTYSYKYPLNNGEFGSIISEVAYPQLGSSDRTLSQKIFFDGIGRKVQEHLFKQGSSENKSTIISYEYDVYGRLDKTYEPIEVDAPANVHAAGFTGISSNNPHATVIYELSPLNRQIGSTMPDWPASKSIIYRTNVSGEVPLSELASNDYSPGALSVVESIDELGDRQISYSDKLGRLIMSSQQDADGSIVANTLYTYDDKSRKIGIYPPGTVPFNSGYSNLIYTYTYSGDDNMVSKKYPDQSSDHRYVYDDRDLLIHHQTPNLKTDNKWILTEYDDYGRPVLLGLYNSTSVPAANIGALNNSQFEFGQFQEYGQSGITIDKVIFDGYNRLYYDEIGRVIRKVNDYGLGSETSIEYNNNTSSVSVNNVSLSPINYVQPIIAENSFNRAYNDEVNYSYDSGDNIVSEQYVMYSYPEQRLTFTYDYDFANRLSSESITFMPYTYNPDNGGGGGNPEFSIESDSKDYDKNNSVYVPEVKYKLSEYTYNHRNQISRVNLGDGLQSIDYTYLDNGYLDRVNNPNSISGDLFAMDIDYFNDGNISIVNNSILNKDLQSHVTFNQIYAYDGLKRIGSSLVNLEANNVYNTSYSYDIRGNFSSIDRYMGTSHIDDMNFVYQQQSGQHSNRPDRITESSPLNYGYDYKDNGLVDIIPFDYDDNGNMTYTPEHNLLVIYDHNDKPVMIQNPSGDEYIKYDYTFDGRLISKETMVDGVESTRVYWDKLQYVDNILNVISHANGYLKTAYCNPAQNLQLTGNEPTDHDYYAQSIVSERKANPANRVTYVAEDRISLRDGFTTGSTESFSMMLNNVSCPEGEFTYQPFYNITDHLGNIRVTFTEEDGQIEKISEHHYYPFGMEMLQIGELSKQGPLQSDDNTYYNYLYNGKEIQEDLGLNWYNYGARFYDPAIGRFTGVDPISDQFSHVSTYNYAENSPIANIDLWGLQAWKVSSGAVNGPYRNQSEANKGAFDFMNAASNLNPISTSNSVAASLAQGSVGEYSNLGGGSLGGRFLGGSAYNESGGNAISRGFEISGINAETDLRLGPTLLGFNVSAEGSFLSAEANLDAGLFSGQGDVYGIKLDANVGAYTLEGEVSGGGSILGIKYSYTVGGSLGSAHAGGTINFSLNSNDQTFTIEGIHHLGLGIGEKGGFKLEIPNLFSSFTNTTK